MRTKRIEAKIVAVYILLSILISYIKHQESRSDVPAVQNFVSCQRTQQTPDNGGMRIRQGKGTTNIIKPNFPIQHNNPTEGAPAPNIGRLKVSTPFFDRVGRTDGGPNITYR